MIPFAWIGFSTSNKPIKKQGLLKSYVEEYLEQAKMIHIKGNRIVSWTILVCKNSLTFIAGVLPEVLFYSIYTYHKIAMIDKSLTGMIIPINYGILPACSRKASDPYKLKIYR